MTTTPSTHNCAGRTDGFGGFTCVECGKHYERERHSDSVSEAVELKPSTEKMKIQSALDEIRRLSNRHKTHPNYRGQDALMDIESIAYVMDKLIGLPTPDFDRASTPDDPAITTLKAKAALLDEASIIIKAAQNDENYLRVFGDYVDDLLTRAASLKEVQNGHRGKYWHGIARCEVCRDYLNSGGDKFLISNHGVKPIDAPLEKEGA